MEKHSKQELWKGNAVARFFLWCSGARIYLLRRCPTEINMFLGIGVVVFLTGIMASISGGYAFHLVFNSIPLAIVFGLFWGVLIFFLDWYLVSSLKKEKKWWKEFSMALPRLILAVFIAVVVARPVEMKLFEKEIDLQVHNSQLSKRDDQNVQVAGQFLEIEKLISKNDSLESFLNEKANRRNELYNLMIAEAEGRSPVGVLGKGPVYQEKRREYDIAQKELEAERARLTPVIASNLDRINKLNIKKDELLATNQIVITRANGFLSRMRALHQLQKEDEMVAWSSLFILLLFIAIEISPVFVKLISSRGPYDELLQAEQYATSYSASIIVDEFSHNRKLVQQDLSRKEELLLNQNEVVLSNAYKELTLAKQEVNKDRIKRWKDMQMKKNGETINKDFPILLDMSSRPELSSSTEDQSTPSS
jgi:hypothetical protein